MPTARERKRTMILLDQKRHELKEKQDRYRNILYSKVFEDELKTKLKYRTDSEFGSLIHCRHCIDVKNHTLESMPKLIVIRIDGIKDKLFCACFRCRTIQCYTCFALVSVVKRKYVKQVCQQCKYMQLQESKPTKKCECSEECRAKIPVTNRDGKPQRYANGHGLKLYHLTNNIKRRETKQSIAEYEREQYSS